MKNKNNETDVMRRMIFYAVVLVLLILFAIRVSNVADHSVDDLIKMAMGIFTGIGYFYFKSNGTKGSK